MQKPDIPNFEFERCCGSGAYGDVWLTTDMNGVKRAVKVLYKVRLKNLGVLDKEIRGLRLYCKEIPRHPNLIEVFYAGETDDVVYYVMEIADNTQKSQSEYIADSLALRLTSDNVFSPTEAVELTWSILDAVSALHQRGLVHRDIKPENIVYVNGEPKLADIGLVTANVKNITYAGTQGFIPPEGIDGYGADLYATGKVLYCALTGKDVSEFPSLPDEVRNNRQIAWLNLVLLKACASNPAKRFQAASEFQIALKEKSAILSNKIISRNLLALAALIISLLAIGIVAYDRYKTSEMFPPSSIMEGDNICLSALEMRLIYINIPKNAQSLTNNIPASYYWISKYEVTQKQYREIMKINPSMHPGDNLPVENISFTDVSEFCRRVTEIERKKKCLPEGYEYRLPTDSEWEFAANGGNIVQEYKYSGSNYPDYYAWYSNNANSATNTVGMKNPNKLNLYDMSGNVWEMCLIKNKRKQIGRDILIRGGSYKSNSEELGLEYKYYCSDNEKMSDTGFRIVLAPKL